MVLFAKVVNYDFCVMFRFKEFDVRQDRCAMKVGTDSVMLGAWAGISESDLILDVGTGTGVLALMMAQRNPVARIDAIEIDDAAAKQAVENVVASKFANRIKVIKCDFREFCDEKREGRYGHIISNPPFYNEDTMSPDIQRAIARNAVSLPFDDLVGGAASLLEDKGLFSVVVPMSAAYSIIVCAAQYEMFLCRRTDVKDTASSPVKRSLLEFVKKQLCETERKDLILHDSDGNNTIEYSNMISAYYL